MSEYVYKPSQVGREPALADFTPHGEEPDYSEADDVHAAIEAASDAGQITEADAKRLHEWMNGIVNAHKNRSNGWPTENMDPEDDTPFGTGD